MEYQVPFIVTFMFIIFPISAFCLMALYRHIAMKKFDSKGNYKE